MEIRSISITVSIVILLSGILSCTGGGGQKRRYLEETNEQRKFELDSLLFPERFVKDSVLVHLFHQGKYKSILDFKDSLISQKGRTLLTIALIEEDIEAVKFDKDKLLPEALGLNVVKDKVTPEHVYEDKNRLARLTLYRKYAVFRFLMKEYEVPVGLIHYFKVWFDFDNEKENDPIIKNEFLYLSSKLSQVEGHDPYTTDYLNYTDSVINKYPEHYRLKALLADVYVDLGENQKALLLYKNNYEELRNPDFIQSIIYYYRHINNNKDSLNKYQRIYNNKFL